jgi:hypothetical protein
LRHLSRLFWIIFLIFDILITDAGLLRQPQAFLCGPFAGGKRGPPSIIFCSIEQGGPWSRPWESLPMRQNHSSLRIIIVALFQKLFSTPAPKPAAALPKKQREITAKLPRKLPSSRDNKAESQENILHEKFFRQMARKRLASRRNLSRQKREITAKLAGN